MPCFGVSVASLMPPSLWFVVLTTLPSLCLCLPQTTLYQSGDVMIGGLFPIHVTRGDEPCASLRPEALIWAEAMMFSLREINRNGTLLPNITLGYSIHDTCGSEQTAIASAADFSFTNTLLYNSRYRTAYNECSTVLTKANRTSTSPFVAVIGGEDSRISINVANVLQLNDIPQISYGATSSELSNTQFTTFFRTVPPDRFQSKAMADIVSHNKWTCVALIGTDDLYGRSGINAFVETALASNICIAARSLFPVHDPQEKIKYVIKSLSKMAHVEIVILYSLPIQAVGVFEEALRQNLTGKTWIASDGWAMSSYIRQKRFIPIIQGTIGLEFRDVHFEALRQHLENYTSREHKDPWWAEFWSEVFGCSFRMNTSKPLCTGTERITMEYYDSRLRGPLIAYVRDAVYAAAFALQDVLKCAPGKDCREGLKSVSPETVVRALRNVSFNGLTGFIDFLKQEAQAKYDIVNLQTSTGDFKVVNVGTWTSRKLDLEDASIQWCANRIPRSSCGDVCRPGTFKSSTIQCIWNCVPCSGDTFSSVAGSTTCQKCSPGFITNENHTECHEVLPRFIRPGDPWGIALLAITCLCITGTLMVIFIFIRHHNTPVFRETGTILNLILLVEILLSYLFNVLLLQKPSDATCYFLGVWFYFVYTSAVITFILKIYHISRRMDRSKKSLSVRLGNQNEPCSVVPAHVRPMWFYYVVGCALSIIPAIFSVLWAQFDGVFVGRAVISRTVVYYTCKSLNTGHGLFLRVICVCYLAVLAVAATIYAYRMNRIPQVQKFREARHLAYSMTLFLVTLFTFYPGWVLIQGPILQVFACSTNLIAATGVILCAYGPKIHLIYINPILNVTSHIRPARSSVTDAAVALGMGVTIVTTERGRSVTLLNSAQSTPPSRRFSGISHA